MSHHDSDTTVKQLGRFVTYDDLDRGEELTRRSMMLISELSWSVSRLIACFGLSVASDEFEHIQAIRSARRSLEHYNEFIGELTKLWEEEQKKDGERRNLEAAVVKSGFGGSDQGGNPGSPEDVSP